MQKFENHEQMRAFVEKEKQRLLEIKKKVEEIKSNPNYILWLQEFTIKYPVFTDDSLEDLKKLSTIDKENVSSLGFLFDCIYDYAENNYVYAFKDSDFTRYFNIEYNNIGYKIGLMSGQGIFHFCERLKKIDNTFIDFNDILLNKKQEKTKFIKEKLNELSNYIMNLNEQDIPLKAIKETVNNCFLDIEGLNYKHNKMLKKISK